MTTAKILITVAIDVDLDDYAETYNIDEDRAEADAAEYLERIVSDAVQQSLGPQKTLDWGTFDSVSSEGAGVL